MELFDRLEKPRTTPFGINAGLALAAVAGGLLLPQYFGTLAGRLLGMQFLVVHAVVMLYAFVWARRQALNEGKDGDARFLTGALWVVYAVYPLVAIGIGGPFGLLEFAALAGGTFLGAWDAKHGRRELLQIGVRWAVAFIALVAATKAYGLPTDVDHWPGARGSVAAAAVYFGVLAAAEGAPRFYRRLAARIWWVVRRVRRLHASGGA